ncbi:hypothetical protein ElyMa_001035900 [Elysia marginata]|uniref:Uncharacterized protein n=1 Tax=Elysia marginata TaxID=1093978 RepID=A0AAV4HMI6_9GAST|nr:hypothetical protein ElyMa_001035900 [Elysia marginata]
MLQFVYVQADRPVEYRRLCRFTNRSHGTWDGDSGLKGVSVSRWTTQVPTPRPRHLCVLDRVCTTHTFILSEGEKKSGAKAIEAGGKCVGSGRGSEREMEGEDKEILKMKHTQYQNIYFL